MGFLLQGSGNKGSRSKCVQLGTRTKDPCCKFRNLS